jgi:hypothetical protein
MDPEARVSALVAPIVEMFAAEVGAELRPDLEAGLRCEARGLVGALDQGLEEKDLRDVLVRQVELEVLRAPATQRGDILRAWSKSRELADQLQPLGLRSRELVREFRAKGRTDVLKAEAARLVDEIVRTARAAPPEVLRKERGTVAVILMNCATVTTDGLLGFDPETSPEVA